MIKVQYSDSGKLKCASCGNYHYQWWMISHQKKTSKKMGCASVMTYNQSEQYYEIFSHYGSGYDTANFKVVRTLFPKHKLSSISKLIQQVVDGNEPIICDKCIDRFKDRGYIVMLNSWFD